MLLNLVLILSAVSATAYAQEVSTEWYQARVQDIKKAVALIEESHEECSMIMLNRPFSGQTLSRRCINRKIKEVQGALAASTWKFPTLVHEITQELDAAFVGASRQPLSPSALAQDYRNHTTRALKRLREVEQVLLARVAGNKDLTPEQLIRKAQLESEIADLEQQRSSLERELSSLKGAEGSVPRYKCEGLDSRRPSGAQKSP